MPIAAPTPSLRYVFKTRRQGWEMVIREQALRSSREQRKSLYIYNIAKWQNKHGDQIVRIVQVRSIPKPIRQGARAWKPWQGGMHVWKATYRGCCQQHSEMKTSISQECIFLLWLISDLSATCGLNFRTTAASCSSWMISFFFVLPRCVAVNPVFHKSRCAVHFPDGDLVLQMFSFVFWPYFYVFWF